MRKSLIGILCSMAIFCVSGFGQSTISGRVTDSLGAGIPGASVKVKGTSKGVSAGASGAFTLSTTPGTTLVFTATGFTEVQMPAAANMTVVMNSSVESLSEVVVTALGIKRSKNTLPYSAQSVSGDDVSKIRNNNFVSNLSGRVAGLEIRQNNSMGASTNVVLRGAKSLTGNNQALFVVDGVPYDNNNTNTSDQRTGRGGYDYGNAAADINPDDIASITVLKGAAASALYGSLGFNGVILITTKKGRTTRGLGVTVNAGITAGQIDKKTFAKYQDQYGGGYGQYYEDPSGFFLYRDVDGDGVDDLVDPTSEDASYGARFDPNLMVYQWDAFDVTSPYYKTARPWVAAEHTPADFYETSLAYNTSVFVDGGGEKGSFKLGYTRNDETGVLPNSRLTKDLLNFSSTYNLASNLTAGGTVNFSKIKGKGRFGTGYDSKNLNGTFRQWWQVNNDIDELKDAYFRNQANNVNVTWNWADPEDLVPIYWDNPYWVRYENYENDSRNRIFANAYLNYKPTSWLNILGRVTLDTYDEMQEERIAVGSTDPSNYSRYNNSYRQYNYDLLLTADKDLSTDFNLKGLLGTNIRRTFRNSINATTNGGLFLPRLYTLANSVNPINAPTEFESNEAVDGYFAGATLTYKEMLILDLTGRYDVSSTLPKGNNSYFYPSVSGGFVFSKLMPSATWLTYGKVRANYAEVQNSTGPYNLVDAYTNYPTFGGVPLYSVNGSKKNPDLKPESIQSFEVGIEASFLRSRLGFDVTYYNSKVYDQIIPVTVSTATGYSSKVVNIGEMNNKGFEVSLYGTPVQTRDFSWIVNMNWTRNRNKVVELADGMDNLQLASFQGGVSINATLGQPYGTIRGSDFIYTNGQKTVGSNGRYLMTSASNQVLGNANPDWIGGISNTLKYKSVSVSFLIDVRQGGSVFSLDQYYGLATGLYPETAGLNDLGNPLRSPVADGGGIIREGVTADGKPNTTRVSAVNYGAYGYRYSPAAGFVYDASYVKLRDANITWSLPTSVVNKIGFVKGLDLSLVGRNLWLIHKNLPYADPEEGLSSGNLQGYSGGAYPTVRSIGVNLKARF